MDFQNVNPLNVKLNILSGNLLPMTSDNSSFPLVWKMYSIVIWLIELIQTSATICGYVSVANSDTLQDSGTVSFVFNSFLRSEDESMKSIVNSTMKPLEIPLEFYSIGGTASVILWCCLPFFLIIKKKYFFYEDYAMIAAFSKQPFSTNVFVLGNIMEGISSGYMFLKKVAIDIYMINIVMLMTAQYRYVAVKLATILRNDASEENENCEFQKERSLLTEKKMKALCRHYNTVILTMLTLKKFLSLNMSYIYLNNIVLFCFIDVLIVNIIVSRAYLQVPVIVMYLCGTLIQLYIMCFCIHQLLDASKEVTDEAFHEKWYQFGPSLKYMFRMIMMANNLNSKFSITEKFSLSLPSFLSILNQSYSIALLLLKMK
ncbi:PREDICTED: uncharacterized protein LOC105569855 isoform X2 [Vollenhovia emeryi]|uniref:uncharacterized protein LOC105569855 isoform X2 n=1 Tax=Vollenhovia emeryi TaxID=411798 RepID=UPI0005F51E5C|nr:PREDICTED: uncharacterized protein LOC105569855 isoform X2 [Vollenhovia emeryi]